MSAAEITSLEDARRYVRVLCSRKVEEDRAVRFWRLCKQATLLGVLAASFLIYHLLSVTQEVIDMPSLKVPAVYLQHAKARAAFR